MKRITVLCITLILFGTVNTTLAQHHKTSPLNIDGNNLALDGYDPVAYFEDKKPIEGKSSITTIYEGVTYRFASQRHKDLFLALPVRYQPQYGGWCAYAMGAKGEKVEVDPETYKILDGKLYLFYNKFFNNTLETWNKNEAVLKTKADKNWSKLTTP